MKQHEWKKTAVFLLAFTTITGALYAVRQFQPAPLAADTAVNALPAETRLAVKSATPTEAPTEAKKHSQDPPEPTYESAENEGSDAPDFLPDDENSSIAAAQEDPDVPQAPDDAEDMSAPAPETAPPAAEPVSVPASGKKLRFLTGAHTIRSGSETPALSLTVSIEDWKYGEEPNLPTLTGAPENADVKYSYYQKSIPLSDVPKNAGSYTVVAEIAGTDEYAAASAKADFTISRADIAPAVSLEGWVYGDTGNDPDVEGNPGDGAVTFYYKPLGGSDAQYSRQKPKDAGSYTVKAVIADTENYSGGTATADFTISKKSITVTAANKAITYGDALPELTPDGSLEEGSSLTGISFSCDYRQYDAPDIYTITPVVPEGAEPNYDIQTQTGTLTVSRKPVTITWGNRDLTYAGKEQSVTAQIHGLVNNDAVTLSYTGNTQRNVGSYVASARLVGEAAENYILNGDSADWLIRQAPLTVTANSTEITYGEEPQYNGYTINGLLGADTVDVTLDSSCMQFGDVGRYSIEPQVSLPDSNYDVTCKPGTLTVSPKEVSLRWTADTALVYNGKQQSVTAEIVGLVNQDPVTLEYTGNAYIQAGTYHADARLPETVTNYVLKADDGCDWSIAKLQIKADAAGFEGVYDGKPHGITVTAPGAAKIYYAEEPLDETGFVHANVTESPTFTEPGDYTVYYCITNPDYETLIESRTVRITKAPPELKLEMRSWTYGAEAGVPRLEGMPEDADCVYTYYQGSTQLDGVPTDAGMYTVKASVSESGQYLAGETDAAFTILPKKISIRAEDVTITYGDALPPFAVNTDELLPGDSLDGAPEFTCGYKQFHDAGAYRITPSGLTNSNYTVTFLSGILTVLPKEIALRWQDTAKIYNGNAQSVEAAVSGLVGTDQVQLQYDGNTQTNAGNYHAAASLPEDVLNYTLSDPGTDWSIAKAPLSLRLTAEDWTEGESAKEPILEGVPEDVRLELTYYSNGAALQGVPDKAGKYTVKAVAEESRNYLSAEVSADFVIAEMIEPPSEEHVFTTITTATTPVPAKTTTAAVSTDSTDKHTTTALSTDSMDKHTTTALSTDSTEKHTTTAVSTGSTEKHTTTAVSTESTEKHTTTAVSTESTATKSTTTFTATSTTATTATTAGIIITETTTETTAPKSDGLSVTMVLTMGETLRLPNEEGTAYAIAETNVADVDENGCLHALNLGETEIIVTLPNGKTITYQIKVEEELMKGDANLDKKVNAEDAAQILIYAAARGAGEDAKLTSKYAFIEAKTLRQGDTSGDGIVNAEDAANILLFAAASGADGMADWNTVLGIPTETTASD